VAEHLPGSRPCQRPDTAGPHVGEDETGAALCSLHHVIHPDWMMEALSAEPQGWCFRHRRRHGGGLRGEPGGRVLVIAPGSNSVDTDKRTIRFFGVYPRLAHAGAGEHLDDISAGRRRVIEPARRSFTVAFHFIVSANVLTRRAIGSLIPHDALARLNHLREPGRTTAPWSCASWRSQAPGVDAGAALITGRGAIIAEATTPRAYRS
jgi:hypothetical protein